MRPAEQQATAMVCEYCDKPSTFSCPGCGDSRYCSGRCRQLGSLHHVLLCNTFKEFNEASRPGPNYYRAMYFPVNEDQPRFFWQQFIRIQDHAGQLFHVPSRSPVDPDALEGSEFRSIDSAPKEWVSRAPVMQRAIQRQLPHTLVLQHRPSPFIGSCEPNSALFNLFYRGSSIAPEMMDWFWKGPVVVIAVEHPRNNRRDPTDFGMSDFNDLCVALRRKQLRTNKLDYQLESMTKPLRAIFKNRQDGSLVLGVRINCLGDTKYSARPELEPVEIPTHHGIFTNGIPIPISKEVKLPLVISHIRIDMSWLNMKIPMGYGVLDKEPQDAWSNDVAQSFFEAGAAAFLFQFPYRAKLIRDLDLQTELNSFRRMGTIFMFRKDKKPLFPGHVDALSRFSKHRIGPAFVRSQGYWGEAHKIDRTTMERLVSRTAFEDFFYA